MCSQRLKCTLSTRNEFHGCIGKISPLDQHGFRGKIVENARMQTQKLFSLQTGVPTTPPFHYGPPQPPLVLGSPNFGQVDPTRRWNAISYEAHFSAQVKVKQSHTKTSFIRCCCRCHDFAPRDPSPVQRRLPRTLNKNHDGSVPQMGTL